MTPDYQFFRWPENFSPNPAMLRHTLEREGYRVFQWCDQPGAVYPVHSHAEAQSHWIISGSLELTIESFGTVLLEAGDRDLMPANTYHSARVIGEEPVLYLVGQLTGQSAPKASR